VAAEGVPNNPGAWLMASAKHRAIDFFRRNAMLERKHAELGYEIESNQRSAAPDLDAALDDDVGDDLLRLMFTACHPVLSAEARAALTLRLLGGMTTDEIARAFLASEATIAQRIVRAKRTLADTRIPFEVPRGEDRAPRLASVLEVIYLVFNEGYTATAGDDWMRPALCEDALRLGRILAELTPYEPEVHGLVALMEIQASRSKARTGPSGQPIVLLEQNRTLWDFLLIRRGLAALQRAERLGGSRGPYVIQASIAAVHARARTPEDTDWALIVRLYDELIGSCPHQSSSSIERSRWAWPAVPAQASRLWIRCGRIQHSRAITISRACAGICWPSSDGSTRPVRNSSAQQGSRATRASAICCSNARGPAVKRAGRGCIPSVSR
jgi:predicted RNA polymerase sigma factor